MLVFFSIFKIKYVYQANNQKNIDDKATSRHVTRNQKAPSID